MILDPDLDPTRLNITSMDKLPGHGFLSYSSSFLSDIYFILDRIMLFSMIFSILCIYLTQGSAMVVFGPTLLDLASRLSSGVGPLAAMLAVRAIGHAVGGVGSGILFDKLYRLSYTFLVGIILTEIASKLLLSILC